MFAFSIEWTKEIPIDIYKCIILTDEVYYNMFKSISGTNIISLLFNQSFWIHHILITNVLYKTAEEAKQLTNHIQMITFQLKQQQQQ